MLEEIVLIMVFVDAKHVQLRRFLRGEYMLIENPSSLS